ncbi:MAG: DUF4270 domain-containing protein [Prevotellaceae bacterium]|jgi:hypothetical protein|nr:DUF4270 domain-containing protein [Prevotellaceae bacterium]
MNSRNLKIFFVVIGIASLLNACVEVDKTLGVYLVPDNAMIEVEQAEFALPIYTASVDSALTSSTTIGAVGWLNQESFGLFTAGSVFRMLPYSLGFDYGEGAALDSAVLTIYVASRTQLDTTSLSQPLSLYRLTRDLAYSTTYYNNSLKPADYDPTKVSKDYTYKGEDTIRILLEDDFAKEIMFATEEERANDTLFLQKFKGFYLKAETSGTVASGKGQVSYFDLTTTYITFTYHHAGNDTARYAYYFIEQHTPNFNVYAHSSSSLSNYGDPLPTPAGTAYLEGLAGVKPYINFDWVSDSITNRLQQAGKDISKLAINRAELVVPVDYTTPAALDLYPAQLTLAYKDTTDAFTFLTDTYFDSFGGALNRSLHQYSFNLTYYVQGLFNNQALYHTSARDMYLYPIYSTYDSYGSEVKLLERSYYTCGILKGAPHVKLKLTYTMLK